MVSEFNYFIQSNMRKNVLLETLSNSTDGNPCFLIQTHE